MFNFLNIFKQKLNLNKYSDDFFYGPSISEGEIEPLFKKNIKTIICHVPDTEVSEKYKFYNIEKKCNQFGINAYHIPFAPGTMNQEHINEFVTIKKKSKGPFYVYCKSGRRAKMMLDKTNKL
ncbi:MAG: beta-lactamase hydrolase domain-containing protein [Alphaproteobacteria bacterium]|jgi:uncharacterized protein (TIGR01244 family)|tara:strand:+ start:62 stop:427 length:366 start_codon:yes stop_codon:yes gene_type:complete